MSEQKIPIPSRLYNAAVGGHVCGPEDVDFGQKVVHLIKYDRAGNEVTFESQVTQANKIYVIHDDFVLSSNVTIPVNCVLKFDGGSVSGEHTITGQNTGIEAGLVKIFDGVSFNGTFKNKVVYDSWFGVLEANNVATALENFYPKAIQLKPNIIKLSKGTYLIDKEIVLHTNTHLEWDVQIIGCGSSLAVDNNQTIFQYKDNNSRIIINPYHSEGGWKSVNIKDIKFISKDLDGKGDALVFSNNQLGLIEYCTFFSVNHAIGVTGNSHYLKIQNCKFYDCNYGFYDVDSSNTFYESGGSNHSKIDHCFFEGCETPILQTLSSNWIIENTDLEGRNGTIIIESNNIFNDVRIERNLKDHIWLRINGNRNLINSSIHEDGGTNYIRVFITGKYNVLRLLFYGFFPKPIIDYGRYNKFDIVQNEQYLNAPTSYIFDKTADITFNGVNNKFGEQGVNLVSDITASNGGDYPNYVEYNGLSNLVRGEGCSSVYSLTPLSGNTESLFVTAAVSLKRTTYTDNPNEETLVIAGEYIQFIDFWDYEDEYRTKIVIYRVPSSNNDNIESLSYATFGNPSSPNLLFAGAIHYFNVSAGKPCFECFEEGSNCINLTHEGYDNTLFLSKLEIPAPIRNTVGLTVNLLNTHIIYNNKEYIKQGISLLLKDSVATSDRPATNLTEGQQLFDTTLGKPIWWNGSAWVDATGATV